MCIGVLRVAKGRSTSSSKLRQQVSALRKRGLTSAKVKGRPGGSAYALIKKLGGVLERKAQPVKLTKEARKKYAGQFPIVKGKAIIPVRAGEHLSFSPKAQEIIRSKRVGNRKFKFRVVSKFELSKASFNLPGNENTVYRFHLRNGQSIVRIGKNSAEAFLTNYDVSTFVQNMEIVTQESFDAA